jgi:transcriptional regulator with XRE-family HTH domain
MTLANDQISLYSHNLRRIMARSGMTLQQVVDATGICERTIKVILHGRSKPQSRTLHRLAAGFGVAADEFFRPPVTPRKDDAIHRSVDVLLASEHRELLTGFIDLLARKGDKVMASVGPSGRDAANRRQLVQPGPGQNHHG